MKVELQNDAWRLFQLIKERDMPSNNTAQRLHERSGIPMVRVIGALNLLWCDGAGFIEADVHKKSQEVGYYVLPKYKRKKIQDLKALYDNWQEVKEDDAEDWSTEDTP